VQEELIVNTEIDVEEDVHLELISQVTPLHYLWLKQQET
jgi:hypothetical protein